jgi:hypothetical protein
MSCLNQRPSTTKTRLSRFYGLHQDGQHLILAWLDRALKQENRDAGSGFERFIYLWIAFNGWASCVTQEDHDGRMIQHAADSFDLRNRFSQLMTDDAEFHSLVAAFADLWPIFRAQNLRRHAVPLRQFASRRELTDYYLSFRSSNTRQPNLDSECAIEYQPKCWEYHARRSETIPLDWPHTIATIYRVRCNLFHGEKSPHSEMDDKIIKAAFRVLSHFLVNANLLRQAA